eukprot:3296092-Prymnesium_polylepis.1
MLRVQIGLGLLLAAVEADHLAHGCLPLRRALEVAVVDVKEGEAAAADLVEREGGEARGDGGELCLRGHGRGARGSGCG